MKKLRFVFEYEINASSKMLFPYFSTASGLAQWFADDVTIDEDHLYNFIWEGVDHKARLLSQRTNSYVKFQYLEEGSDENNASYVEFKLESNELTQTTFIRVVDYSDFDDPEEQSDMWLHMLQTLKETVGG
jgi:uncharacterized protein YndB with AHSA1/START domain